MKKIIAPLALLAALPFAASAGQLYFGAGVGSGNLESSNFFTDLGTTTFKGSDVAFSVFGGYQITDHIAAEIDYINFGKAKDNNFFCTGCNAKAEPEAVNLVAVGSVPVAGNFELFGKAGISFLSIKASCNCEGQISTTEDSEDLTIGLGVGYKMGNFRIRAEADWIDAEDVDSLRYVGVSASYGFTL